MKRKDFLNRAALGIVAIPFKSSALATKTAESFIDSIKSSKIPNSVRDVVKITDVKVYRVLRAIFIKVETDTGITGWGEAGHDNPTVISEIFRSYIKPMAIDKDPFQSEVLWHNMVYS